MDVQMPVLDGYNATRAIRKDPDRQVREVLVIAMTASAIRGDREKCLEAGMNDYLAKPVRQAALKEMLDEYIQNTRSAQLVMQSEHGERPTPGEKVNMETMKGPIKTTPVAEKTEAESLKLKVDTSNNTNRPPPQTNGSNNKEDQIKSPVPSIIVSPTEGDNNAPLNKPKKKRIPLKGSKRSAPENGAQASNAQSNGAADNNGTDEQAHSPPSGVMETQITGKVSTEVVSPDETVAKREKLEKLLKTTTSEQIRNQSVEEKEKEKKINASSSKTTSTQT